MAVHTHTHTHTNEPWIKMVVGLPKPGLSIVLGICCAPRLDCKTTPILLNFTVSHVENSIYLEVINLSINYDTKLIGHEHVFELNLLELPIFNPLSLERWQFHMVPMDPQVPWVGSSLCNTRDT